jgi:hypothetical protein
VRRRHCLQRSAQARRALLPERVRSDRRRRKVEPRDDRAAPRQADRVKPEMASQMNEPSAGHLADFGINDAAQGVIAGLDTVNRVKPV